MSLSIALKFWHNVTFKYILNNGDANNYMKPKISPSSNTGCPHHMHEFSWDEIAFVCYHGCPDLFITLTCNPSSYDIQLLFLPEQLLESLMDFIVKHEVFGSVRCWMYSVELQSRLLPYACILIWIYNKLTSNEIHKTM